MGAETEDDEAAAPDALPDSGLLLAHGLQWSVSEVSIDSRRDGFDETAITWTDRKAHETRTVLDYWKVMFPSRAAERIINSTNAVLPIDSRRSSSFTSWP
jgi:hypothetical protein